MGTVKKISLVSGFSAAINLPRFKDATGEYPLYPHTDGSKVQLKRSDGWYKHAVATYNSPSNARVVCLSKDAANVLYWTAPVKGGKQQGQFELAGEYVFDSSQKAGVKQTINKQMFYWENAGLKCLVEPVVMSNIEELWVAVELFNCPVYAGQYKILCGLKPGQVSSASFLYQVLEKEISTPSKQRTIKDTFPLLRSIVVVSTQQQTTMSVGAKGVDFHKYAVRTNEVKEALEKAFPGKRRVIGECAPIMKQIAAASGFGFAVCPIATGDILKFGLGDYKFDTQFLSAYREALFKKYSIPTAIPTSIPTPVIEDIPKTVLIYNDVIERLKLANYKKAELLKKLSETMDIVQFSIETSQGVPITTAFRSDTGGYKILVHGSETLGVVPADKRSVSEYAEFLAVKISECAFPPDDGKDSVEEGKESLLEVIIALEKEFSNSAVIKKALFAYKTAHPDYFKQQIPLLPKDVHDKYTAVFQ